MATDIIARGMAASSVRPGSDGKIPAEYLPSYVDDIIDLLTISDTAPATCAEGDKYYNSTSKLIFTATGTNTWGTTGETPASGVIYINTAEDPSGSYRWDGLNLVLIGASGGQTIQYTEMPTAEAAIEGEIVQYIGDTDSTYTNGYFYKCVSDGQDPATYSWENIQVQTGSGDAPIPYYFVITRQGYQDVNTIDDTIRALYNDVKNGKYFSAYTQRPWYSYTPGQATTLNMWLWTLENNVTNGNGTVVLKFKNFAYDREIYLNVVLNITNDEVVSRTQNMSQTIMAKTLQQNPDFAYATTVLDTDNRVSYVPTKDFHPSTKKYVDDNIKNKTLLLNYDAGDYNDIYFNAENIFGTTLPATEIKKTSNLYNYSIDYTYTTAQAISPATNFLLNFVIMAGGSYISAQSVQLEISVVRDSIALKTITKTLDISRTTGLTADSSTINAQLKFNLELEEPLAIQANDIFRVKIINMQCGSVYGYLYSSASDPTYIEQYSNGINAEYVYDTINGATYSQHEINAMGGGGDAPIYLITGTTQADVDKINECCNLFTQNKPFTAYYKSTAQYGPKYVPITFFTMGTSDIFMNFIGWAGYSGNGQTLVFGQIQGTGTPGQYSAIQIYDDPSTYREVISESYFSNLTNYSAYKNQVLENNNGTLNWVDGSVDPTVITDNNTTYTIASLTGNKAYKLGELTDLTITAVTTFDRESIIYFSSGSTPTDISIPDTIVNLGDAPTMTTSGGVNTGTCEASKSYIISILNNIAVWKAY